MSTAVLDPRTSTPHGSEPLPWNAVAASSPAPADAMRPTLDEWLTALWAQLERGEAVACPACGSVCGTATFARGAERVSRCNRCGSSLC